MNDIKYINRSLILFLLAFTLLLLTLIRILIYSEWQFPAPVSDNPFFSSVSINKCANGEFQSYLFPIDWTGQGRYIWHGILQPYLVNILNINCSNTGQYVSISIISIITVITIFIFARKAGIVVYYALTICAVALALQFKQQFRPETLAILICIVAEFSLQLRKNRLFVFSLTLLAWTHPLPTLIYTFFTVLRLDKEQISAIKSQFISLIFIFITTNIAIYLLYPFPIADLIRGILLQGKFFSNRWEFSDIFEYLIRSDFFPLVIVYYGFVAIGSAYINWKTIFIVPVMWWVSLRTPSAYYNIAPLSIAMLVYIIFNSNKSDLFRKYVLLGSYLSLLLALFGISQGIARDINSYYRLRATSDAVHERVSELESSGHRICGVPHSFVMLFTDRPLITPPESGLPQTRYRAWNDCTPTLPGDVDLVTYKIDSPPTDCIAWSYNPKSIPILSRIFRSDSGYSFAICPHQSEPEQ